MSETHQQPLAILKKYWGFDEFRPLQEDIILSVLGGNDTLALLPTGGGKSICFQVPALSRDGICVVISPLIALMQNQVNALQALGIKAVSLDSSLTYTQVDRELDNCVHGETKFLYISPERLRNEMVQVRLGLMKVNLLAVDEAHCISEWGYDFRPSYLQLQEIRQIIPNVPVLALTATATPAVVTDIQEKLNFKQTNVLQKSFERKNVAYMVLHEQDTFGRITRILNRIPGTSIIYVRNRKMTKDVASRLVRAGVSATFYHAGLSFDERKKRQHNWIVGTTRVVVATNAFGMGIDKPDVRTVIHLGMPDSLEAYFQEVGRAGRDGKKSFGVALLKASDVEALENRLNNILPPKEMIVRTYEQLSNYFQLAIGSGEDHYFPFNLIEFSTRYNLNVKLANECVSFLERAGYLTRSQTTDPRPRILFIASTKAVYQAKLEEPLHAKVIETLFRSYGHLYEEPVPVNLNLIAKRCELKTAKVKEVINRLNQQHILKFMEAENLPKISFILGRQSSKNLHFPRSMYEDRVEVNKKRILEVLAYARNEEFCRSQILLKYFGERNTKHCEICDVCLSLRSENMSDTEFEKLRLRLLKMLKNGALSSKQIEVAITDVTYKKLLRSIQILLDRNELITEIDGRIGLAEVK